MTDKTKQEELRNKLEALEYDGYDVFEDVPVIDLVLKLINSEVLQALEEVKSKQVEIFPCDCQFNKGFAYKKGDPCDGSCVLAPYRESVVSAIDELERKYRNE